MYEIKSNMDDGYVASFTYKSRNSLNQIIECNIYMTYNKNFWVKFFITTKRKDGYQKGKCTGRDGLKSLLWAKNCIIDFIKNESKPYKGLKLIVCADGERRWNTYNRSLIPLGFKVMNNKYKYFYIKL